MTIREQQIRDLAIDLERWTREFDRRQASEVTLPGYLYFLAEKLVDLQQREAMAQAYDPVREEQDAEQRARDVSMWGREP